MGVIQFPVPRRPRSVASAPLFDGHLLVFPLCAIDYVVADIVRQVSRARDPEVTLQRLVERERDRLRKIGIAPAIIEESASCLTTAVRVRLIRTRPAWPDPGDVA